MLAKGVKQCLATNSNTELEDMYYSGTMQNEHTQCKMSRGSATVCGSIAYFGADGSSQVHSYNLYADEWSTLPDCPHTI